MAAVLGAAADAVAAEDVGGGAFRGRRAQGVRRRPRGDRARRLAGTRRSARRPPLPADAQWARRPRRGTRPAARRGRGDAVRRRGGRGRSTPRSDLVTAHPQLRAVTRDGDLVGAGWVSGGSDRRPSTLEITSEIESARSELAAAETQADELAAALAGALAEQSARQDAAEQALAALNESDATISSVLRASGPARSGRPRGRGGVAAPDRPARRARGHARADRRRARRARATADQCRAGAEGPSPTTPPSVRRPWPPPRRRGQSRSRHGSRCGPPRSA